MLPAMPMQAMKELDGITRERFEREPELLGHGPAFALYGVLEKNTGAVADSYASGIATRLQQVLDDWNFISPQLQDLYDALNAGRARHRLGAAGEGDVMERGDVDVLRPLLGDAPLVEDHDPIGHPDGRQAVRHHHGGSPLEQLLERRLQSRLGLGVHAGRRLVEQE